MITTTNITVTCAWLFNFKTITNFDTKDFDKQFSLPGRFLTIFVVFYMQKDYVILTL